MAVDLLDVPLVLLGSLQNVVIANTAPNFNRIAPIVIWMDLLNGAGGIALSVAAALLAIATAQTLSSYPRAPDSKQNLDSAV